MIERLKIASTTEPPIRLNQNDWMKEFKVSSQVKDTSGLDNARRIMWQWDENKNESIWKTFVNGLKLVTNF